MFDFVRRWQVLYKRFGDFEVLMFLITCAFISIEWRRVRNDHSDSQVEPCGCVAFSSIFAGLFNPSFIDEWLIMRVTYWLFIVPIIFVKTNKFCLNKNSYFNSCRRIFFQNEIWYIQAFSFAEEKKRLKKKIIWKIGRGVVIAG